MRAVGVVGSFLGSGDDAGVTLDIVLCKAIRSRLCGSGLEIIEVAVHFLIVRETLTHMVKHILGKRLGLGAGHIGSEPVGVEADLIHADKADSGEVVVKGAEVTLGVGIKTLVEELCDYGTLDLERTGGDIHHLIKAMIEVLLVLGKIGYPGQVDGDNADGACALTAAEEAAGLLAKLTKVKAQTAAHGADVARLHIAVDIV